MKVLLVVVLVLLVTATALAFGPDMVNAGVGAAAAHAADSTGEPAALLISGSALLALAGAVKRLTF